MKRRRGALASRAARAVAKLLNLPAENLRFMLADAHASPERVIQAYTAILNSYGEELKDDTRSES